MFGFGKKKTTAAPPAQQPQPGQPHRSQGVRDRNQQQAAAAVRSAPDPDADTEADLQQYFTDNMRGVVDPLVTAAADTLTTNLKGKLTKVLEGKKKKILADAQEAVKTSLAANPSKQAKDLDPKALIGETNAWDDAIAVAGTQATTDVAAKKGELTTAAEDAYEYEPDGELKKSQRAAHLAALKAIVKKALDAKAKELETALTESATSEASKATLASKAQEKADATATGDIAQEMTDRGTHDQTVKDAVKTPVKTVGDEIRAKELAYLEKGLGAKGGGWYRSARFKSFHQNMKTKARELGHESTDGAIAEKRAGRAPGATDKAAFEYQTTQAKALTHDGAKLELRTVMAGLAKDLRDQADGTIKVDDILTDIGTAAAWGVLRQDPTADKTKVAAGKAADTAIKGAKKEADKKLHDEAKRLKDEYVKAGDGEESQDQKDAEEYAAENYVKPALGKDNAKGQAFGKKMLQQAIEAPTAGKGLELVAKMIDAATPQVGDETELSVELKIPASHGAFVYFTVTGNAARSKHMEVGIDIGFGAGWETWGLSARGGFNVFLKAGAADTVTACQMLHYGAFRNLAQISDSAANFWAGSIDPKRTGGKPENQVGKTEQAELWAAMMEERAFGKDKDAFVEVGGGGGASAKLNAGITGEVSGKATSALRWDKETIDKSKTSNDEMLKDRGTKTGATREGDALAKRAAVNTHAKRVNKLKFGTSIEAEANGQKFSIGVEAERTGKPVGADWSIQLSGGIPYDGTNAGSTTMLSKIASSYVPAALGGVKKIYDLYKAKHPTPTAPEGEGDGVAQTVGGLADTGEDLLVGLDAGGMTNNLMKSLAEANPQEMAGGQADGVNDTARLFLGKDVGMKGAMGSAGDMDKTVSDAPTAQPFGMSSQLQVLCIIEVPEGGTPKVTFKVVKAKELKMGGDLGAGVGLSAKLTRKQELAGFSLGGDDGPKAWVGGRG